MHMPITYYEILKDKNKELIAKINETIKKMKADGRYDKIIAKYELNLKK